jgi:hypothetical protein
LSVKETLDQPLLGVRFCAASPWEEGREETQLAIARKALSEHPPIETIQLITGFSPETIRTLRH